MRRLDTVDSTAIYAIPSEFPTLFLIYAFQSEDASVKAMMDRERRALRLSLRICFVLDGFRDVEHYTPVMYTCHTNVFHSSDNEWDLTTKFKALPSFSTIAPAWTRRCSMWY